MPTVSPVLLRNSPPTVYWGVWASRVPVLGRVNDPPDRVCTCFYLLSRKGSEVRLRLKVSLQRSIDSRLLARSHAAPPRGS